MSRELQALRERSLATGNYEEGNVGQGLCCKILVLYRQAGATLTRGITENLFEVFLIILEPLQH